jgi:hypothetical protein
LFPLAIKAGNQAPEHRGLFSLINLRQFSLISPPFFLNVIKAAIGVPWP